ncbi:MAG: hypothetical protein CMH83_12820 [Nocardioides sp.]|nr:hypothetical protein [Nocardioides sp.]
MIDPTPLTGPRVSVTARIGWLMRSWRTAQDLSLGEMASRLGEVGLTTSVPALSTAEREGARDGLLIDAYERVLGLDEGRLRATVDILCRRFSYAPLDRRPERPELLGQADLDAAVERVVDPGRTGGAWLWLARVLDRTGPVPSRFLEPLAVELVEELVRSVGPAYLTRYEAVARMRRGWAGDLLDHVLRRMVDDPGARPCLPDAFTVLTEAGSPDLLVWLADRLADPDPVVVVSAGLGVQSLRSMDAVEDDAWHLLAEPFLRAVEAAAADPDGRDPRAERGQALTSLFKNLPPGLREQVRPRLPRPLWPVPSPVSWSDDEHNVHLARCGVVADALTDAVGIPRQPLLARLLFEAVYDFRNSRVATSGFLLQSSPVAELLPEGLLPLVERGPDEATRIGAIRALLHAQVPHASTDAVQAWVDRSWPLTTPRTLAVAGNATARLPQDAVDSLRAGTHPHPLSVVEALGLAGDPAIARLVADAGVPDDVRAVARWWHTRGARVVR